MINYDIGAIIGYTFTLDEILAPFLQEATEDKWAYQPRFDHKTGLPIEPEKIQVAYARKTYIINGISFIGNDLEAIEELVRSLDVRLEIDGYLANPTILVSYKEKYEYMDYGRVTYKKSSLFLDENLIQKLFRLKEKLESAGIRVTGQPKFMTYCCIG